MQTCLIKIVSPTLEGLCIKASLFDDADLPDASGIF